MNILVVIEHSQGSIHRLSKEAIVGSQSLGNKVTALVIGEESEETISSRVERSGGGLEVDNWGTKRFIAETRASSTFTISLTVISFSLITTSLDY